MEKSPPCFRSTPGPHTLSLQVFRTRRKGENPYRHTTRPGVQRGVCTQPPSTEDRSGQGAWSLLCPLGVSAVPGGSGAQRLSVHTETMPGARGTGLSPLDPTPAKAVAGCRAHAPVPQGDAPELGHPCWPPRRAWEQAPLPDALCLQHAPSESRPQGRWRGDRVERSLAVEPALRLHHFPSSQTGRPPGDLTKRTGCPASGGPDGGRGGAGLAASCPRVALPGRSPARWLPGPGPHTEVWREGFEAQGRAAAVPLRRSWAPALATRSTEARAQLSSAKRKAFRPRTPRPGLLRRPPHGCPPTGSQRRPH